MQAIRAVPPALLTRMADDGVDAAAAQYDVCGILSIGLRPHEDDWFAPFARLVTGRSPGTVVEITPTEAQTLFPPLGPVHRVLHHAGAARIDGRGMAAAVGRRRSVGACTSERASSPALSMAQAGPARCGCSGRRTWSAAHWP